MTCQECAGYGLVKIAYRSKEAFDLGICKCPAGRFWRRFGTEATARHFQLGPDQHVAELAWFTDELIPLTAAPDFIQAGLRPKAKAKL